MTAEVLRATMEKSLASLGRELGAVVFANKIGNELAKLLQASQVGELIDLVFTSADPGLLSLPFEAARLPDGSLPVLHPAVSTRRNEPGLKKTTWEPAPGPLKILVAVGAPDEGKTAAAVLDVERELQKIQDAVQNAARYGNTQVKILEVGHRDEIRKALEQDFYHILHLSCHGRPGMIELENEDGEAVPVTARDLAAAIQATGRALPLIFLSSCHGGTVSNEMAGFAHELLQSGIPLVLSMQTEVSDYYAIQLAGKFYEILSRNEFPIASRALALARKELEQQRFKALQQKTAPPEETQPEFATATLYSTAEEKPILNKLLDLEPLKTPPVESIKGPVPWLRIEDLVGRRAELRTALKVLRDDPHWVSQNGQRAGVVLRGIGGIGKSSLAGRIMARLAEAGWIVAATTGPWQLEVLTKNLGLAVLEAKIPQLAEMGNILANPKTDDETRFSIIQDLLKTCRVCLIMDNFEDNLTVGGAQFVDSTLGDTILKLLDSAATGKILFTCRYPIPGTAPFVAEIPLGPLSRAQTRKLLLRLPGLKNLDPEANRLIYDTIGGHPRMLEYLDGIMRGGIARLTQVTGRLQQQARQAGISLNTGLKDLPEAVQEVIVLGAHDILLNELLTMARDNGDEAILYQTAVSRLPVVAAGVAYALGEQEPDGKEVAGINAALHRLTGLSLVSEQAGELYWVHRWTAESLKCGSADEVHQDRCRRMGEYRLWNWKKPDTDATELFEAVRNFLEAREFD